MLDQHQLHVHVHVSCPHGNGNAEVASLRVELEQLKERVMTVREDLVAVKADFTSFKADILAKVQRLQDSVDNPSTESRLSPEDAELLADIKASVADARTLVGDEDGDGVPAAPPVDGPVNPVA